ncbi:MAG: inositol monophosphatase [Chloroflexi bacterium]|jgi:myo-inositol-1(or 4)-monophosphatase|nr:inositol monophosphatase [Chloroflexota bacterium]
MLETAIRAAREAGRVLVEQYQRPHEVRVKGFRDIATEADFAAEKVALDVIREGCPDARFVSEESFATQPVSTQAPTWYVDPLDGTTNFARGLPLFSVSVAMAQGGQVQVGAVYDPLLDQLFYAERGQGAYLNGERLRVSERQELINSLVLLDWPRAQEPRRIEVEYLARLAPQVDAIRSRGSAALGFCSVAAGWVEAYFQYTLGPWDVAAGWLILEEAGGKATDLRGERADLTKPDWLATNGLIHEAMLAVQPFGR